MTHDLFKSFSDSFQFEIEKIVISEMKEGVFYAKIHSKSEMALVEIDSRPSDAIAIAVRFGAAIFCSEKVLSEAGIEFSEEDKKEEAKKPSKSVASKGAAPKESLLKDFSLDKLNSLLDKAILDEDYEKAARIRDEINKRN
jgi:bifunctional DNase/RNase